VGAGGLGGGFFVCGRAAGFVSALREVGGVVWWEVWDGGTEGLGWLGVMGCRGIGGGRDEGEG
jgi:hypothetical protein